MTTNSTIKRELPELRTLYLLKPHFRDVVVEGRDDAAWFRWFLAEQGLKNVKVFAVDDRVNVSRDLVEKVDEDVNARGRVVALAAEYETWGYEQPHLTCIADADYDVLRKPTSFSSLLKTDYASMEVYAIADRPLSKFLVASAKADVTPSSVRSLLKPAWAALFALRYVLHYHSDGVRLADNFASRCVGTAGEIMVDARNLLLSASPTPSRDFLDELLSLHAEYLKQLPNDSLQGIRGHDIAPILIRFLGLKNDFAKPDYVERLMRQAIELRDVEEFGMFRALKARLGA